MRYTSSHPRAFHNRIAKSRSPRRGRADRDTGAAECRAGTDENQRRRVTDDRLHDRLAPSCPYCNNWIVTLSLPAKTGGRARI